MQWGVPVVGMPYFFYTAVIKYFLDIEWIYRNLCIFVQINLNAS